MEFKLVNFSELEPAVDLRSAEDEALGQLAESIKAKGIIAPLMAKAKDGGFSVLDGRRRLKALEIAGAKADEKVPVLVVDDGEGDDLEKALVTNAVRSELDAWDLAESVNALSRDYGRKAPDLAAALGKTERYISSLLSLFTLPKNILKALRERRITPAHGRCLVKLNAKSELQREAFKRALEDGLSVRDLEVLVGSMIEGKDGGKGAPIFEPVICSTKAGSRLRLEPRRRSIRIEINLKAVDDLDETVEEMRKRLKKLSG